MKKKKPTKFKFDLWIFHHLFFSTQPRPSSDCNFFPQMCTLLLLAVLPNQQGCNAQRKLDGRCTRRVRISHVWHPVAPLSRHLPTIITNVVLCYVCLRVPVWHQIARSVATYQQNWHAPPFLGAQLEPYWGGPLFVGCVCVHTTTCLSAHLPVITHILECSQVAHTVSHRIYGKPMWGFFFSKKKNYLLERVSKLQHVGWWKRRWEISIFFVCVWERESLFFHHLLMAGIFPYTYFFCKFATRRDLSHSLKR